MSIGICRVYLHRLLLVKHDTCVNFISCVDDANVLKMIILTVLAGLNGGSADIAVLYYFAQN